MLKSILKITTAIIISTSFIGTAIASSAHYGVPSKALTASAKGTYSSVVLYNYTPYDYTAYAVFQNSGKQLEPFYVGSSGSGMDVITYDIDYPDTKVCLTIVRNIDHASIYEGCSSYGNVKIGPYTLHNKPSVKVE